MMLQIKGGTFTAGVVLNQNSFCVKAAPIIKYMVGWSLAHIVKHCHNRGWRYEVVDAQG